ncbi:MAG: hypothetical protein FJ275_01160 [Planctomycetes bacterium]|nr:hypothetical protein [Planctomycetota bacterium]
MGYFGPEAMFVLSLDERQRDFLTDTIEEALKLRMEGLDDDEIQARLAHAILAIERWTKTPRIIRRIILGTLDDDARPGDRDAQSET